ncbi:MAG: peptidoglycan DD-metalloendopeptidase family protein [Pseudomonadota bacterium]
MMRAGWTIAALAVGLILMAGCDAVRYPGDGGEAPRIPPTGDDSDGPGPAPPMVPVSNPYGDEDEGGLSAGQGEETGPVVGPEPDPVSDPDALEEGLEDPADTPPEPPLGDEVAPTDPQPIEDPDVGDQALVDGTEADDPPEPVFSYFGPGQLSPGSGTGAFEQIVHAPDIVFPIRSAPAYLQSQVWNFGGGVAGGDQCDSRNFAYPWRDNFCETRTADRGTPFCPLNRVHQGQDIRVGTPEDCRQLRATAAAGRTLHEVVAVEDGLIYDIGTYTVKLRSGGRIYRYMHLNMAELQVQEGDTVEAGDILGYVSNDFGGTPTTFHLHFEIIQNTEAYGWEHVPPYLSLVEAYERREQGRGDRIENDAAIASARILPIPEGLEIIE